MTAKERAAALHGDGYNCAQSVFCALAPAVGVDENLAKAVSIGFGGGMRCGEVCGAIAGAVMAVGMAYSKDIVADPLADGRKKNCKECTGMVEEARKKFGAIRCHELKSPERMVPCDQLVAECAELAEIIINDKK